MAEPLDEMLYPLKCPRPECGHQFQVIFRRLVDVKEIACEKCGVAVPLTAAERARDIGDWLAIAEDLRKQRIQGKLKP